MRKKLIIGGMLLWWLLREKETTVGQIVDKSPPGQTPCKDGTFSDFPYDWRGGVCSYHRGRGLVKKQEPEHVIVIPTSKRLEILRNSLANKEQELNKRFNVHFDDVRQANGQPLNDKRNGRATLNRWEKQSDAIRNQQREIERTQRAIEFEQGKVFQVEHSKEYLPTPILEMIELGQLNQWRKHPNIFFVPGVDKARIVWDEKNKVVAHKFTKEITDKAQWAKFAKAFNSLAKTINKS